MHPTTVSSPAWWSVMALLAFEHTIRDDHDPTGESLSGVQGNATAWDPSAGGPPWWGSQVVSATFQETIRDFNQTGKECLRPTVDLREELASNLAHEVLHALRLQHGGTESGGLMCARYKNYVRFPHRLDVTEQQRSRLRGEAASDGFRLTQPYIQSENVEGEWNDLCRALDPC